MLVAVAVILAAGVALLAGERRTTDSGRGIPVARVERGDLSLQVHATGELQAIHTMMLSAPAIGGGTLHITHLLHTGVPVKKGDIVIEFDPTEQTYKLEQSRSELLQADQEITKAQADAAVLVAQDKVALLKAQYAVRNAELDVQLNELKSAIDARKNILALNEAKRALAQLEQDIKSHTVTGQASITLAREKHNKARLAMDQAQENITKMRVRSPMDGLVAINKNDDAAGGIMWRGMSIPDFREGDQVQPGTAIAEVIDPDHMELKANVAEGDRNNVKVGEKAEIRMDARPGRTIQGTVTTLGGASSGMFWDRDTAGTFSVTITLADTDPQMRPGLTAGVLINGGQPGNVIYVPRQALFLKDGKRVVYLGNGSGFTQEEVKVDAESESRAAVEGLKPGAVVAMIDPTAPQKSSASSSAGAAPGGGTP